MISKFAKRKEEVQELERLTIKIKLYIKNNKAKLMKEKSENEQKIFDLIIQNNATLKNTIINKKKKS
jgi:hypothetical protein